MQQKWVSKLMGYDFIVEYKKGKENLVADALPRQKREVEITFSMISLPSCKWTTKIKSPYNSDAKAQDLWGIYLVGNLPSSYLIKNGVLFYKDRVYFPNSQTFISKLLELVYSSPMGGHLGLDKTIHRLKMDFYWLGQKSDVKNFFKGCGICQVLKVDNTFPSGLLQPLPHTLMTLGKYHNGLC